MRHVEFVQAQVEMEGGGIPALNYTRNNLFHRSKFEITQLALFRHTKLYKRYLLVQFYI